MILRSIRKTQFFLTTAKTPRKAEVSLQSPTYFCKVKKKNPTKPSFTTQLHDSITIREFITVNGGTVYT